MNRRTKGVLLIGSLAVATAVTAVVALTAALAKVVDPHHYCESGFSKFISCTYHRSSRSIGKSDPIFASSSSATSTSSNARDTFRPLYTEVTSWAVARCPENAIGRRLLCATPSAVALVEAASADLTTGLPRPKPWVLTTARNSPFIKAVHVETPLDLTGMLRFYRTELSKRGWTENGGAVVEPDRAVIAYMTADGPALLRLTHYDDRTTADLSLRKPAANAAMPPGPGQARLLLGNAADEEAVITVNEQTIKLAARVGQNLMDDPETGRKSPDSPEINLAPGKYKVSLKIASGAAQSREFEVAADETWGLLAGPAGVPLPLHLY